MSGYHADEYNDVYNHRDGRSRRNEIVIVVLDFSFSNQNVEVEFLNATVAFPEGPALLAKVTEAPLLSVWLNRPSPSGPAEVTIGSPVVVSGDHVGVVQQLATRLEEQIRRDPPTWAYWLFGFENP